MRRGGTAWPARWPRPTGTGSATGLGASALIAAGITAGYPTLVGIGAAGLALGLAAVALVAMPVRLAVSRTVAPERVTVGAGASGRLEVRNTGRLPSGRFGAVDAVHLDTEAGAARLPPQRLAVPALRSGFSAHLTYTIATPHRGLIRLGPMVLERRDPLGLARRGERLTGPAWLWVHPRTHPVRPLPVGVVLDFEGRLTDRAPRGSTAFASLREYRPGDDPRQIHWRSTARRGSLVVQERVDTTEPATAIVLDTRSTVLDRDEFEHAIEVAASLVTATRRAGQTVNLAVLGEPAVGGARPAGTGAQVPPPGGYGPMDRLAAARRTDEHTGHLGTAALLALTVRVATGGSLVVITGLDAAVGPRLSADRRRFSRVVVVQLASGARPAAGPAVTARAGLAFVRAANAADATRAFSRLAGGRR